METKGIYKIAKDGYKQYGSYVNNSRHIPLIFDGLKPSYRRTIYAALQLCGNQNKFIKSAQLSGYVIGNLHPHGQPSVDGVIAELVNSGILEGQGNFGGSTVLGEKFEAASSRYTEVRLDPRWHSIFNELLPYVEWEDSYIGMKMPSYLPTPIPLSLLFGSLGIGFGTGSLIPNFAAKSLIEAYKEDDPYKLYPAYNNITFDYTQSEFECLWDKGYAKMSYMPKITKGSAPDCGDGIYINTDTRFITPNIPTIVDKVNAGRLFMRDESDMSGDRLFIGRYPKLQENMDYYLEYCKSACTVTDIYRLYVTDGTTTSLISLRDWIDFTYNRYLKFVESMKVTKIAKIEKEIRVLELIPRIGKLIHENPDINEQTIVSTLSDSNPQDIHACLSKPIKKLMRSEFGSEINSLRGQAENISKINPNEYTMNILNKM
jgi:DNA gyrase/topoisomerase IV subunit A